MDELQILKDKYDVMPHGPARIQANREAVRRSDELGDQGWSLAHRYNLASELTFHGDQAAALPVIAEYAALSEQMYFDTGRPTPRKEMDRYLYMLYLGVGIWLNLPQLPLEQREQMAKKFWDGLQRYQYGKANYYTAQYYQLLREGKMAEAEAAYQAHEAEIATGAVQVTECAACDQFFRVRHAVERKDWEEALREARPLLDGTLTCRQNPWNALWLLMTFARDRGDRAAVKYYGEQLVRRLEWDEGGMEEELLPYYSLFDVPRGLQTLEKTLDEYLQSWSQDTRMDYFCDAWLLLTQAARAQETVCLALSERFPLYRPDGEYDPAELADWFHRQALDIAYRFDQRNGYPAHQKKIETAWAGMQKMVEAEDR